MTKQPEIPPALTLGEWAQLRAGEMDLYAAFVENSPRDTPRIIAALNDELPDDDPRKITWSTIDMMRRAAWNVPDGWSGNIALSDFADALASYLPPREAR